MNLRPLKLACFANHACPALKEVKKAEGKSNKTFDAKHWLLKGSLRRRRKLRSFLVAFFLTLTHYWLLTFFTCSSVELWSLPHVWVEEAAPPDCWQCGWPILDLPAGGRPLHCSFSSPVTSCQVFWCCSALGMHISSSQSLSASSHNYPGLNGYLHSPNLSLWNLS